MNQKSEYTLTLDDDPVVHRFIEASLGLPSQAFNSVESFLAHAMTREPAGIFVDIHLGGPQTGLDVLPTLRARWPYCPIIVVTADDEDETIGEALAAGANDFVKKPINGKELKARFQIRSIELGQRSSQTTLSIGDVTLDLQLNRVTGPKGTCHLSQTDMRLLVRLVEAKTTIVPKTDLKRILWGDIKVSDNALDKKIYEVRQALKDASDTVRISSVYGRGIRIEVAEGETKNVA